MSKLDEVLLMVFQNVLSLFLLAQAMPIVMMSDSREDSRRLRLRNDFVPLYISCNVVTRFKSLTIEK